MVSFNFYFKNAGLDKLGNTREYDEEFSTEMYDKVFNTASMPPLNPYNVNGVHLDKTHDFIRVVYEGILAENGAEELFAVVSYDDDVSRNGVKFYPMDKREDNSYEVLLPVNENTGLSIAFKDGADHWDNNSGTNYTFNKSFYGGSH